MCPYTPVVYCDFWQNLMGWVWSRSFTEWEGENDGQGRDLMSCGEARGRKGGDKGSVENKVKIKEREKGVP